MRSTDTSKTHHLRQCRCDMLCAMTVRSSSLQPGLPTASTCLESHILPFAMLPCPIMSTVVPYVHRSCSKHIGFEWLLFTMSIRQYSSQRGPFFVTMFAGHQAIVGRRQETALYLCLRLYNVQLTFRSPSSLFHSYGLACFGPSTACISIVIRLEF